MGSKRCGVCNRINEEDRVYCKFCGAFLDRSTGGYPAEQPKKSIWEVKDMQNPQTRSVDQTRNQAGENRAKAQKQKMICPRCGTQYMVAPNQPPFFCQVCSYFFQETRQTQGKTDRPEKDGRMTGTPKERNNTQDSSVNNRRFREPEQKDSARKRPMGRAKEDISSMRLIGLSAAPFLIEVPEEGGVLGSRGTLRPELFRGGVCNVEAQHLVVWHTPAGWYLRPLKGSTVYNGEELNAGVSVRISDGDYILAGDCNLRVEITAGRNYG